MRAPPPPPAPGLARRAGLLAAISAIALAACATVPPAAPARIAKAPQAYETRASLAAPLADWPGDRWWSAYGDAQLDQLIQQALVGSPTLASAEARVRRAEAAVAQSRASQLPTLSANASAQEMKQSYNNGIPPAFVPHGYNDYGALSLNFSWELDFWGKNRAAVAAATSDARAAQADAAEARLVLSTNIAAAYADLARLYAERDVAERAVSVQQETSHLVSDRVANGLDTRGEQRQAEAEPLQSRADLGAIDEQIALTRNRLAALVGAGPDRGLSIARPAAAALKPFGLPQMLAAELVGRRPDVTAARWRAEAAASRIKQAKAAFYPNVNLAGFIGAQSLGLNQLFKTGSDTGALGPAISLPIFEGGRLRAGLRGAEADRDAAVASYDAALTEAFRQVADVVASERALAGQLADSRAALVASEDAYRIARLRYQGGLSTYQSVLLAEQNVLRRRRTVADLDARAFALDVALVRALGGGFQAA
ncbi:MAG: efflux system, outer rane lipoprotein NodT family [Phenylobacterium sp.]|nr:efflux system, outer rane lipoprotein NodT family [Phenylobacterium sp.]